MKALTIYQPWASLIMCGAKPYEFRGWSPRERGGAYAALIGQRIVIHASAKAIARDEINVLLMVLALRDRSEDLARAANATCLHADRAMPVLNQALENVLALGAGLGTAILGKPRSGFDIAEEFGLPRINDSERDEHANFGWPMLDVEVWDQPVPMRGLQGFWKWPTPEWAA